MKFNELIITINSLDSDKATDIITMCVAGGMYIEDYSDLEEVAPQIANIDLIDEELLLKDKTIAKIHIYFDLNDNLSEVNSFLTERFNAEKIKFSIDKSTVNEDDWADSWKKYFKPTKVGKKILICPSWEKAENDDGRKIINIDPGAAFGTGTHATTTLCMQLLEDATKNECNVLDIGCGSGILSITAMLLGAGHVTSVDIDITAVKVAKENAKLNGYSEDQIEVVAGSLFNNINRKFNLIVANIVADVIIKLCDDILKFMEDDAEAIFSGIIVEREQDVLQAMKKSGLHVKKALYQEGWVALLVTK